jgi:hypothetical protein
MIKNKYAANKTDASAKALNAGMDLYGGWGDDLWGEGDLEAAITAGMTSTTKVDDAVRRTTMHKMKVGLFNLIATTTHALYTRRLDCLTLPPTLVPWIPVVLPPTALPALPILPQQTGVRLELTPLTRRLHSKWPTRWGCRVLCC